MNLGERGKKREKRNLDLLLSRSLERLKLQIEAARLREEKEESFTRSFIGLCERSFFSRKRITKTHGYLMKKRISESKKRVSEIKVKEGIKKKKKEILFFLFFFNRFKEITEKETHKERIE